MGYFLDNAVMTVSGTPGTGTITLGSAVGGSQTFAAAGAATGQLVPYALADINNGWEYGKGLYTTSGTTLARSIIIASSNGGSAISASSSCIVTATLLAEDLLGILGLNLITGNLPSSIAGTNTTATLTTSAGFATDSTGVFPIKAAGYSWAVTNGNAVNGYQGGTTLPNSTTIHFFVVAGSSGVGSFASTSESAPTLPAGYSSYFRRIFSIVTTAAGALIPYTADEVEGGAIVCYLSTPTFDQNAITLPTASRTLYTMNVPQGIKVNWMGIGSGQGSATLGYVWITSPDEPDIGAASNGNFDERDLTSPGVTTAVGRRPHLITNTSGQIGARGSAAVTYSLVTTGFVDYRRG
jgi:hypothetical protein